MGFFDFLKGSDINLLAEESRSVPDAVLLDVRTVQEYRQGHIPGSKNVPLQSISKITSTVPGQDTPLYVYCYSGSRSRQAVSALKRMGYTNVKNIGGIAAWRGKVVR